MAELIAIAVWRDKRDTAARIGRVPWDALAKDLSTHARTECHPCLGHSCNLKDGAAWSPVELSAPKRGAEHVRAVTAFVVDLDGVTDERMAQVGVALDGHSYVVHSTHSGHGSYRLVMPLSRPITPAEWPRFWQAAVAFFGLPADRRAKDIARIFFYPSCSRYGPDPLAEEGIGASIDVDQILLSAAVSAPATPGVSAHPDAAVLSTPAGAPTITGLRGESRRLIERVQRLEPLAPAGERDDTINRVMSVLANVEGANLEWAMSFISTSLERMDTAPEGAEYWRAKAAGCFTRAAERRAKRDVQRASDSAQMLSVLGRAPEVAVEGTDDEWRRALLYRTDKDGNPTGLLPVEANVELVLRHDPAWRGKVRFDELRKVIVAGGPLEGVPLADQEFAAAVWFQRSDYRIDAKRYDYGAALLRVARAHPFDPLREYLEGLSWDGERRAGTFLNRYLQVPDTPATRVVGVKWLLSAVARGLAPGCKMDNILILQGDYGVRKSSFVEVMAGEFYSNVAIDFTSNDGRQAASRYWLIEMPEVEGLRRAAKDAIKNWLSTRVDSFRPPYGRVLEDWPRRAVFVGTANDDSFLQEPNRREWVIAVKEIDVDGLRLVRDQLWAEAVAVYRAGASCPGCQEATGGRCDEHSWWLHGEVASAMREVAREYAAPDPWRDTILDWFLRLAPDRRPKELTATQVAQEVLGISRDRVHTGVLQGVGVALRMLGFSKTRVRRATVPTWVYLTPAVIAAAAQGERMRPATFEVLEGGKT